MISTALESGDFHTALPLLENMTSDQLSELTLPDKCTPLHYACRHGRVDVAQQLITHCKYSIESKDGKGCTPLHTAAQYGQVSTLKYLLNNIFVEEIHLLSNQKLAHTLTSILQCQLSDRHRDQSGKTPLHTACVQGQLDIVQLLTHEIGCDPNDTNSEGLSCLHLAAQHDHLPLVRYLIEEVRSDVTLEDENGRSPTYLAAGGGHLDILKYLIGERRADPRYTTRREWNTAESSGRSLLHTASHEGHLHVVRYLIEQHGCDPSHKDYRGVTPLYLACQQGHMDIVTYLTTEGNCNPNCTSNYGRTCLHPACHLDVVKYLVDIYHCDPLRPDKNNNIPLHLAACRGHLNIVKFFIEDLKCKPDFNGQFKRGCLHNASQNGHINVVKYLVDIHHCDPLCPDKDNITPFHLAVNNGHLKIVKFFIENLKYDPNCNSLFQRTSLLKDSHKAVVKDLHNGDALCPNEHNNTPLHFAALNGHLDIVKLFIEDLKCDPNCNGRLKGTPLHKASQNGHIDIVKYLGDIHHCDPLCPDKNNNTPLHLAALNGHLDIVKFFIEDLKCDSNCTGRLKRTPLHKASQNGHIDVVKYLVEVQHCDSLCLDEERSTPFHRAAANGRLEIVSYYAITLDCNLLIGDKFNDTPLHHATLNGHLKVIKFITEDMKCDPNCKGDFERTPLHLASEMGHLNVVKYLVETHHCDPLCPDRDKMSPLQLTITNKRYDITLYFSTSFGHKLLVQNRYNSLLHYAALKGSLKTVQFLIEDIKCDPKCKDQHKRTPLHHACEQFHFDVVKYLIILQKCNPLSQDEKIITPLHLALIKVGIDESLLKFSTIGSIRAVKFIVENRKCDLNYRDNSGKTPLHHASEGGHLDVVKCIVNAYCCDPKDYFSNVPLHYAALNGHLEVVKFFIEEIKCDPNCKGQFGRIPLHYCSEGGHLDCIKYLVETHHCDPLQLDENMDTPLHMAVLNNRLKIIQYISITLNCELFVEGNISKGLLHYAAKKGYLSIVKLCFNYMSICDPNCKGQFGRTPLHFASEGGHLDIVKYLVDTHHCDITCLDEDEQTPLHRTAKSQLEVVRYFTVIHKHRPSPKNIAPVHLAAHNDHLEIVKFFIENTTCDPNIKDQIGSTPLHHACEGGSLDVVKYLIDSHYCDPLCRDNENRSPLHSAASNGHLEIIKFLTAINCNTLVEDKDGYSPLHYAAACGHMEVVKFFIEDLAIDPNIKGHSGWTPLMCAVEDEQSEVIKYFVFLEKYKVTEITLLNFAVKRQKLEALKILCSLFRLDHNLKSDRKKLIEIAGNAAIVLLDLLEGYMNVDPLHNAAITGDMELVRHYIETKKWCPNKLDQYGNNTLHNAAQHGQLEVVKYLTGLNEETIHCDPSVKNEHGLTADDLASLMGRDQVLSYLLRATTNKLVCQQDIISPSLNIFVVGNSGSGKSTLVKALSEESGILRRLTTVKGVTPLTAGIVPTAINSRVFGDVRIYDFAGHEEYYASNEILLQKTSHPLVLLTINLSSPLQEIEKQLHYWLSILSNCQTSHVVVIGSHSDVVKSKERTKIDKMVSTLVSSDFLIRYHGFIQCDCRYSSSDNLNLLRRTLNSTCRSIRLLLAHKESYTLNQLCASLMYHLKYYMPEQATVTVDELCKQIEDSESTCPNLAQLVDQDLLIQTCKNLSSNGHMLFLPHSENPEEGYLVLDEKIVLSRVHACLTVIKKELENTFGILDENQLQSILSKSLENLMEPDFAIKYLIFTQFCTEIMSDQLIVSLDKKNVTYYFFPNLVLATRPPDLLPYSGRQTYTNFYTWCLKCTNAHQFFTPRYLHTLFIQIVKCERDTANTEYKIWKNGILLVHSNGTRSIIEVTDQTTRVYLAIQCVEGYEFQLVKQRSFLISIVRSLMCKICPRVKVEEVLLLSQDTYPPNNTSELPISKVALSIISGHGMVSYDDDGTLRHELISDLLHFESFLVIEDKALQACIHRDNDDIVPLATLARIHSAVETCRELQKMFEDEAGQCRRDMTYSQVHNNITKYSIFTDKDIYVS